jgi:hypothetical protein
MLDISVLHSVLCVGMCINTRIYFFFRVKRWKHVADHSSPSYSELHNVCVYLHFPYMT